MAGSSWPALVAHARARASDVEAKFDWIEGNIVPMVGGSQTDAAYDVGTSAARWRDGFFSRTGFFGSSLVIGDTSAHGIAGGWFKVGTDRVLAVRDNLGFTTTAVALVAYNSDGSGQVPLEIRADSFRLTFGNLALAATSTSVNEFSTDGTLAGNSDLAVPTEKAVKSYVDNKIAGTGARAYLASFIGITGTAQKIPFDTESYDTGGEYDNVTNFRFTAATTGTYLILGALMVISAVATKTSNLIVEIRKNGSTTAGFEYTDTFGNTSHVSMPFQDVQNLASGDYVEIFARQGAGFFLGTTTVMGINVFEAGPAHSAPASFVSFTRMN